MAKKKTDKTDKSTAPKERRLTEKQENFCQYYLDTGGNASEAYRMAYDASNMKAETINYAAWELLKNSKITQRIDEIKAARAKASEADRRRCNEALMNIVNANPKGLFFNDPKSNKPKTRSPQQLSDETADAISDLTNNNGKVTYRFHGKVEAARLLAQMNGWLEPEKHELRMDGNIRRRIVIGGLNKNNGSDKM